MPINQTKFPGIYISTQTSAQEEPYKNQVESALEKIAAGSSGNDLLQGLSSISARKNRKVTIAQIGAEEQPNTRAVLSAREVEEYKPRTFADNKTLAMELARKGSGCNAIIEWSPQSHIELNANGSPVRLGSNSEDSFVVLAHELIHAQHLLAGTSKAHNGGNRYNEKSEAGKEELRAVGVGKYEYRKTKQPSENSIRQEHGLPIRKKYKPHGM
ncbi:XopG/HopH/AvrPtoH family type III secretion system effector [Xanthomonas fragariae]|uniref:XopG/HopH/AvrPtoH family type III secretion system effector n=1 Tax=Xanthomonas fragariae TaxID=48664 RepID=UPI001ABDF09C|nr:type III secretion system effector protein [Xanthomonas fragariae]UKR51797.1 type III secretion system effector protein [Xanthomonas fragariae]